MEYEKLKCDCEFAVSKRSKRLYCKKHNQFLIYVYVVDGKHRYVCQVGEDELIERMANRQRDIDKSRGVK